MIEWGNGTGLVRCVAFYINLPLLHGTHSLPRAVNNDPTGQDMTLLSPISKVEWKRNVMAHTQKPDLVFQGNGRVHLYRRRCQFSRLLAAEVCASAVVMLDRRCSHTVHECWLPTPFASFPFTSPPVLRRVPSDSISTLYFPFTTIPLQSVLRQIY